MQAQAEPVFSTSPFLRAVLADIVFDCGVVELHLSVDFPLPEWQFRLTYFHIIKDEFERACFYKQLGKFSEYCFMWDNDTMTRWDCDHLRFDDESERTYRADRNQYANDLERELWRRMGRELPDDED